MDKVGNSWILLVLVCLFSEARTQENVIRFTTDEINEILDTHNDLRRSVFNAANMRELTWNEAVAFAASEWGSSCEYVSQPGNQWGQNMNYFYGDTYHKSGMELFRESFHAWANETRHYDYRRYRYCGSRNVCSYVQLIAADVQQVGCTIVKCPKLEFSSPTGVQRHAKLLLCFYTPWVNILGREVFIPDKRCAACPQGTTCVDNLCSARFYKPSTRTLPIGSPSVQIETISGPKPSTSDRNQQGSKEVTISGGGTSNTKDEVSRGKGSRGERQRHRGGRRGSNSNRVIGRDNSFGRHDQKETSSKNYQEHRSNNETVVVYTPNNRVIPFPGRSDRRNIKRIEKFERNVEKDLDKKQEQLMHSLELVASNITIVNTTSQHADNNRKKRQVSMSDSLYVRRLEYERYLREYENLLRERKERRRRYEEELRRREQHQNHVQELRRAQAISRYNTELERRRRLRLQQERTRYEAVALTQNQVSYERERRRRRRLRDERRRLEALALLQNEGELTGEEQFFTISAHNLLRREVGAKDMAWSSYLERWAKYVIRCETEYPGPIKCYTNFGKADRGQDIYNVVYQWGAEGNDLTRPLQYGCRTPYDRSLCNHNTIIRDKSLTQMACASKSCGSQRQLTCIYSSG